MSTEQAFSLQDINQATELLNTAEPVNLASVLGTTSALFFGENHVDYAGPRFLQTQVDVFKNAGVTSMGFEINPSKENRAIIEAINSGNSDRIHDIDWSNGFGNPIVRIEKEQLVRDLVGAGIKIYAFAPWDDGGSYNKQKEREATLIIKGYAREGKTVVLIGGNHAKDTVGQAELNSMSTVDVAERHGISDAKTIMLVGGMRYHPLDEAKNSEARLRAAIYRKRIGEPCFIPTKNDVKGLEADGIIALPEEPFLSPQDPVQPKIKKAGPTTPVRDAARNLLKAFARIK